jgi:hypothetical protein
MTQPETGENQPKTAENDGTVYLGDYTVNAHPYGVTGSVTGSVNGGTGGTGNFTITLTSDGHFTLNGHFIGHWTTEPRRDYTEEEAAQLTPEEFLNIIDPPQYQTIYTAESPSTTYPWTSGRGGGGVAQGLTTPNEARENRL